MRILSSSGNCQLAMLSLSDSLLKAVANILNKKYTEYQYIWLAVVHLPVNNGSRSHNHILKSEVSHADFRRESYWPKSQKSRSKGPNFREGMEIKEKERDEMGEEGRVWMSEGIVSCAQNRSFKSQLQTLKNRAWTLDKRIKTIWKHS